MNNFRRAVKLALRYRGRLAVSLVCALLAAALWGLNIAALYPVLQLVQKNRNLQDWVDTKLADVGTDIANLDKQVDKLSEDKRKIEAKPPGEDRENDLHKVTREHDSKESKLAACRSTEWRYQQLKHKTTLTLLV